MGGNLKGFGFCAYVSYHSNFFLYFLIGQKNFDIEIKGISLYLISGQIKKKLIRISKFIGMTNGFHVCPVHIFL